MSEKPDPAGPDAKPRLYIVVAIADSDGEGHWEEVTNALLEHRPGVLVQEADADAIRECVRGRHSGALVVAHGANAIDAACRVAASSWAIRGLALVEGVPLDEAVAPPMPTMILLGRQSDTLSHEAAVRAFERLRDGRIVELENCGNEPQRDRPDALAAAVSWFAETLMPFEGSSIGA